MNHSGDILFFAMNFLSLRARSSDLIVSKLIGKLKALGTVTKVVDEFESLGHLRRTSVSKNDRNLAGI